MSSNSLNGLLSLAAPEASSIEMSVLGRKPEKIEDYGRAYRSKDVPESIEARHAAAVESGRPLSGHG
jgi:hypothetical protein